MNGSVVVVASPSRTRSISSSGEEPWAGMISVVRPSELPARNSSARRREGFGLLRRVIRPADVGERRFGNGDSMAPLRFLPVEDHLTMFLKSAEATLQGVQYQFSRRCGMTSLLCSFDNVALASDALLKLGDVLIGFGEVISFVEHGGGTWYA
jgi:hypothetical protein